MPTQPRRYVSTATDRARERITAAVHALIDAERAVKDAREARDQVLREEFLDGVDTRDLVQLHGEAGYVIGRHQVIRIHGGHRPVETP